MDAATLLRIILKYIDYDALLENEPSITRYEINRLFEQVSKLLSNSPSGKSNELYNDLHLYIDGAARGNPGPASVGCVVTDKNGAVITSAGKVIGKATNNVAEYQALLYGLELIEPFQPKSLTIFSDSELLVKQMTSKYKVRNAKLMELQKKAVDKLSRFPVYSFYSIPRKQNAEADNLANKALDSLKKD
jgi:ribonuclease HI/probable phosphoglycerate mutase